MPEPGIHKDSRNMDAMPLLLAFLPPSLQSTQMWLIHLFPGPDSSTFSQALRVYCIFLANCHPSAWSRPNPLPNPTPTPPQAPTTAAISCLHFLLWVSSASMSPEWTFYQSIDMVFSFCQPLNAYSIRKAEMLSYIHTTQHRFCHTVENFWNKGCHETPLQSCPTCSVPFPTVSSGKPVALNCSVSQIHDAV